MNPDLTDFQGFKMNLRDWEDTVDLLEKEKEIQYGEMKKACEIMAQKIQKNKPPQKKTILSSSDVMSQLSSQIGGQVEESIYNAKLKSQIARKN
jgi:hypothetical protein